jgi:hypothetical protein
LILKTDGTPDSNGTSFSPGCVTLSRNPVGVQREFYGPEVGQAFIFQKGDEVWADLRFDIPAYRHFRGYPGIYGAVLASRGQRIDKFRILSIGMTWKPSPDPRIPEVIPGYVYTYGQPEPVPDLKPAREPSGFQKFKTAILKLFGRA